MSDSHTGGRQDPAATIIASWRARAGSTQYTALTLVQGASYRNINFLDSIYYIPLICNLTKFDFTSALTKAHNSEVHLHGMVLFPRDSHTCTACKV